MSQPALKKINKNTSSEVSTKFEKFLEDFFRNVPDEDLKLMTQDGMVRTAKKHWQLANKRKSEETIVRVYTPAPVKSGQEINRTVIDIVSDDMPFLVDSVAAEISRHNRLVHILLHPLLYVKRTEKTGKISYVSRNGENAVPQSHLRIELKSTVPDALIPLLKADLERIIQDVYWATRDWALMRKKLRDCQNALSKAPSRYDDRDIEEYLSFLEYLYQDNFTFLGFREYNFTEKGGEVKSQVIKGSSLGLLSDEVKPVYISETKDSLPQNLQRMRRDLPPLSISKVNKKSTVHRHVPLDAIAIKRFDDKGKIAGEYLFIGLFTSVTYSRSIQDIPYLNRKTEHVMHMSGFERGNHDYKALRHILEKYPRDELFQITVDDLLEKGLSILRLQERPRIALYTRPDPFGRYVSCLVYVPRDRYDTRLRVAMQKTLEEDLQGQCADFYTSLDDSPLARIMFTIIVSQKKPPVYDTEKIEARLQDAGRVWGERLEQALLELGEKEETISDIVHRYCNAFPAGYREHYTGKQAVYDINAIKTVLTGKPLALDLYRTSDCDETQLRLKIYHPGVPVILSDVLPILENMGLRVESELPFKIKPNGTDYSVWVHDFLMKVDNCGKPIKIEDVKDAFEEALAKIWAGEMDSDGLNRLVLTAGMTWRETVILKAYVRYLRQAGYSFSTRFIEQTLTTYSNISRYLIDLFKAWHDPEKQDQAEIQAAGCSIAIDHAMEDVPSLDEDRVLRSITKLVEATLRTNFFQMDENGEPKPYLSLKLDSRAIDDLPEPRPFREIFIYSPRMEGVHLRCDKIARGGIRWSDRHEDFRTEILGLMKAQQVKNSVIVPMGAKGGFIVKRPPDDGDRKALLKEGIACYKELIRGLLDITDNRKGKRIIPPKNVVRRDADDPYLVVAADKGTASFSDIANELSQEYGFWLGDAFASGGSAGYDHKEMGITARGAWESVKLHFRELNHDIQSKPFDVIGVGDMSGDVFGNGMLLSQHIRLVGAFNHLHIFCDPHPNPSTGFDERKHLFEAVKGWDGYNKKKLSKGGKIYNRSDKSLHLTPEIRARFDIDRDRVTPAELIQAMLRTKVDLLWFGGIGTYLKASRETHADVGDKANDALRINTSEVGAHVIGEGANLAITQLGRIEFSRNGGKINADYIDNSGGVDSSDHEVNIKILLTDVMSQEEHGMTLGKRNKLLERMTDEIARLVLKNNDKQAQAISLMLFQAADKLPEHSRLIKYLEHEGLNRERDGLPDRKEIQILMKDNKGLSRPTISLLQAYTKIALSKDLLVSNIPDEPEMYARLFNYFPKPLRKKYEKEILRHRLKREIIATTFATSIVNRMGATFVNELMDRTGANCADVARAYIIVREAFCLSNIWTRIKALDNKVSTQVQLKALCDIAKMAERETAWFLTRLGRDLDITQDIAAYKEAIDTLRKNLDAVVTKDLSLSIRQRTETAVSDGLPKDLAHEIAIIPTMGAACDIIRTSMDHNADLLLTARIYFELGERFHINWLRKQARYMTVNDRWSVEALDGVIEQLNGSQAGLTVRILNDMHKRIKRDKLEKKGKKIVAIWIEKHAIQAHQLDPLLADIRQADAVDLPMLIIAEQRLRNLHGG